LNAPDLSFPHLGITINHLISGITLPIGNGFEIKFYGIIIAIGIIAGYLVACHCGKRDSISKDTILDFLLYGLIFAIIGARTYYVAFSWDYYSKNPLQILNLRGGGLAIYGGVIASVITLLVYTRIKKLSFLKFADCCVPGLALGQCIGRWGNFFNCEAFGDYTDGFFAMRIKTDLVYSGYLTDKINANLVTADGATYIQVHPTFLYESMWNLGVVAILLFAHKHKKINGQIFFLYLICYGLGRVWIEGLRTDQLLVPRIGLPVSQILSGILIVGAIVGEVILLVKRSHCVN
jgi:phosphatidylglycerol:prolipoprotein diacylglycerol transferase